MAMIYRTVPKLVLAQRVVDKIANAASQYLADETGEAMVGLVVPDTQTDGAPTIFVLDTISPDETTVVRQAHTFQSGDALQDEIIWWLQENWVAVRRKRRDSFGNALQGKWDVPLRYLGDWHKQPGFMIKPSMGDLMTALDWIDDPENKTDFLLVPIVTLGHPSTTTTQDAGPINYITIPMGDGTEIRVDFWFIHQRVRMFQPMSVTVWNDDRVPGLMRYPWHLIDDDRYQAETAQIHGDGLFTSVMLWEVDEQLPLEICFLVARQTSDKMLFIITEWDYPLSPPRARIAPFVGMDADDDMQDVFEHAWAQSTDLADPPGWTWTEDTYLIDYIQALESAHDLRSEKMTVADSDLVEVQAAAEVNDAASDDSEEAETVEANVDKES